MAKPAVDTAHPALLDHIGIALWQAALSWKSRFDQMMVERGYPVFAEAASGALAFIGPKGLRQSVLAARMAITKQAAQQFIDRLESLGLVTRLPDPLDARGKIVVLTDQGKVLKSRANTVKLAIEADYRLLLGRKRFDALQGALEILAASL